MNYDCDILVFAPHPDDEVLGTGGTIAKATADGKRVIVCIATSNEDDSDIRKKECEDACSILGIEEILTLDFPDLALDRVPHSEFTGAIQDVIQKYRPQTVFTPYSGDLHTDHKALAAAVLVALRPKYSFIPANAYMYETLSETGWDYMNPINEFIPNVYVDISCSIDKKVSAFMAHESQQEEPPLCRNPNAIVSLARYRGTQAGMYAAEAFSTIRRYEY